MILRGTMGLEAFDVETRCKEGAYHRGVMAELFDPKYSDAAAFLMAANAARRVEDKRWYDIDEMNRVLGKASYYQDERSEYDYYQWRGKFLPFWTCERSLAKVLVTAYVAMLRLSALGSWGRDARTRCTLPLMAVGAAESCATPYRIKVGLVREVYAVADCLRQRWSASAAARAIRAVGGLEDQVPHRHRPQWYGRVLAAADVVCKTEEYW